MLDPAHTAGKRSVDSQQTKRAAHWQEVYQTKADHETSWFQDEPAPSLDLIKEFATPGGQIVDVGGGSSILAGRLAAQGFNVTAVDISNSAIDRAKSRAGKWAESVRWIAADVTDIDTLGSFDLWHDRAVFHFLTDAEDRRRYALLAERSVVQGGQLIIGAFALDGPEKCSGLPVTRYDEKMLAPIFSPAFTIIRSFHATHTTPWGKAQSFFFAIMRRAGSGG